MKERIFKIEEIEPVDLLGVNNKILKNLKLRFPNLKIISRGRNIKFIGEEEELDLFEEKINLMVNYFKKYGVKGVIGLLPCDPGLPFLDGVAWTIDQIPPGYAVYIPEMGLVFGNTSADYNKEDGSQVGKEILKLRQKKSRVLGETQNDSLVNVNFYKFLEQNIYRYMNKGSRKFKREQTKDFSPFKNEGFVVTFKDLNDPINYGRIKVKTPQSTKQTQELKLS